MPIKQVIVSRKDLNMRRGKQMAQACHASFGVFLQHGDWNDGDQYTLFLWEDATKWLRGNHKKIAVGVDSLEELEEIETKAKEAGIPCYKVTDAGLTEFGGVPTVTCVALGPYNSIEIDKITGHLKLL